MFLHLASKAPNKLPQLSAVIHIGDPNCRSCSLHAARWCCYQGASGESHVLLTELCTRLTGEACNLLLVTGTPGTSETVWHVAPLKHLAGRQFSVVIDRESRIDRIFTR